MKARKENLFCRCLFRQTKVKACNGVLCNYSAFLSSQDCRYHSSKPTCLIHDTFDCNIRFILFFNNVFFICRYQHLPCICLAKFRFMNHQMPKYTSAEARLSTGGGADPPSEALSCVFEGTSSSWLCSQTLNRPRCNPNTPPPSTPHYCSQASRTVPDWKSPVEVPSSLFRPVSFFICLKDPLKLYSFSLLFCSCSSF